MSLADLFAEQRRQRELERQQQQRQWERENPPIPESNFLDVPSKYAELLREADQLYREKYKRQPTMRALFVNLPDLCPHLVERLDGTGEEAKIIIKGEFPLSWRQFREKHFKRHFPDLL
ncbi:MAG: hypothetical protein R3E89_04680 [Thiolinea sp.]